MAVGRVRRGGFRPSDRPGPKILRQAQKILRQAQDDKRGFGGKRTGRD